MKTKTKLSQKQLTAHVVNIVKNSQSSEPVKLQKIIKLVAEQANDDSFSCNMSKLSVVSLIETAHLRIAQEQIDIDPKLNLDEEVFSALQFTYSRIVETIEKVKQNEIPFSFFIYLLAFDYGDIYNKIIDLIKN